MYILYILYFYIIFLYYIFILYFYIIFLYYIIYLLRLPSVFTVIAFKTVFFTLFFTLLCMFFFLLAPFHILVSSSFLAIVSFTYSFFNHISTFLVVTSLVPYTSSCALKIPSLKYPYKLGALVSTNLLIFFPSNLFDHIFQWFYFSLYASFSLHFFSFISIYHHAYMLKFPLDFLCIY